MVPLLSRIAEFFTKADQRPQADAGPFLAGPDPKSRRRTERQKTSQTGVVWVTLSDNMRVNVNNVSYGGMSLCCSESKLAPYLRNGHVLQAKLHIYHLAIPVSLAVVHGEGDTTGCSFIHSAPDTLLFLRQVLEFIRIGSSVVPIPKEYMVDDFVEQQKQVYTGDRGTEIMVHRSSDTTIEMYDISFIDGDTDCKVIYTQGGITFQRFKHYNASEEFLTLQQGFFILLGFMEHYMQPGLELVAQAFRVKIDSLNKDKQFNRLYLTG